MNKNNFGQTYGLSSRISVIVYALYFKLLNEILNFVTNIYNSMTIIPCQNIHGKIILFYLQNLMNYIWSQVCTLFKENRHKSASSSVFQR